MDDFDALRSQVASHLNGVRRVVGEVIEAVGRAFVDERQDFNELRAVDVIARAVPVFRVASFFAADEVYVVVLRCRWIGGVDGDVRDTGDRRSRVLWRGLG